MTEQKPEYQAGITPQRQVATETPTTTAPTRPWQRWGEYGWWLGDSERRYGKLHLSRNLPVKVKLEMLRDPVIALTAGFVAATLVKAKRVVECQDEAKRRFFEAMFYAFEREFMLQASMAALLGSCGLIKRFAFKVPQPREIDAEPVWTNAAVPYVIEGFDQAYPVGCVPRFDNKRRTFQGIDHLDGRVDVFFSLWVTLGQYLAFGDYWGKGRLENSYKHWWIKNFAADNFLVWVQRQINPSTQVDYPPGKDDGDTNREVAIATGNAVRAGSTVALPSTVYDTIDPMSGEESLSNVRKWAISFLESSGDVGRFHEIEDQCDRGMALGMLVPPQSFLNVKQTALGGPTTADVLMDLADELLMMDCADLDRHVNDYVFPAVARANFPPDSPPVRVRTVGLERENTELLHELIGTLMKDPLVDKTIFDLRGALEQERMPVVERGRVVEQTNIPEAGETAAAWVERILAQAGDEPDRETLERILRDPLPRVPPVEEITDDEVRQALEKLAEEVPEPAGIVDWEGEE